MAWSAASRPGQIRRELGFALAEHASTSVGTGVAGYAAGVLSLVPLSVTGWVLGGGCAALILLAGWGLFAMLRGRGGNDGL